MKNQLIVLAGPTAVGKTDLAVRLAETFQTEIVSADSRQIYKEMEIGTAKPSHDQLARVPHHFVNTHSVHEEYSAGQFGRDALEVVKSLFQAHDKVVLCGGSGLYIKAVVDGFDDMPEIPAGLREKIMAEYDEKGLDWLKQQVEATDPDYFATVDQENPHRLVRALELNLTTGQSVKTLHTSKEVQHDFDVIRIGLELDRAELNERIDNRVDAMISAGLFAEVEALYPLKHLNALQTVGYQEIFDYLDGHYDRDEAIRLLKRNTRRYAKRQMTWFRRDPAIKWFRSDQFNEVLTFISGNER